MIEIEHMNLLHHYDNKKILKTIDLVDSEMKYLNRKILLIPETKKYELQEIWENEGYFYNEKTFVIKNPNHDFKL